MSKAKKVAKKKITHTKRGWKLDASKVSSKPHEIEYVRLHFYKISGNDIIHPEAIVIQGVIKVFNNSRKNIYEELYKLGYKKLGR